MRTRGLTGCIQRLIEFIGTAGQCAHHAAAVAVGFQCQAIALTLLKEFGQGILQQRECTGLLAHILHNCFDQPRFQMETDPFGRSANCLFEFARRERQYNFSAFTHQIAEVCIQQRAVIEIGPHGDDYAQLTVGVTYSHHQTVQKTVAFRLILRNSKQLFKLVDDQQ